MPSSDKLLDTDKRDDPEDEDDEEEDDDEEEEDDEDEEDDELSLPRSTSASARFFSISACTLISLELLTATTAFCLD